jgi:hypothetical protein
MRCQPACCVVILGLMAAIAVGASLGVGEAGPFVSVGSDHLRTQPGTVFGGAEFKGVGTDTIVRRLEQADAPVDTIDIELVSLQLMSVAPVGPGGCSASTLEELRRLLTRPENPGVVGSIPSLPTISFL